MGVVFRIAKPGKSVYSTDPNDFVIREDLETLKVKRSGVLGPGATSNHGLGYVPIVLSMVKFSSTKAGIVGQIANTGSSVDATNVNAESDIRYYILYHEAV
jgi:hypothetical protein